jgi:FkbM family methyltransferase
MSIKFAEYARCLNQYCKLAGLGEAGHLLCSIIVAKLGVSPGMEAIRAMQRWQFFQALRQESSIHVTCAQKHEFRVYYGETSGKLSRVEVALRVPDCDSSDARVFQQVLLLKDYGQVLDWFFIVSAEKEIKTIMDIGANIGCSALFFSTRVPDADIFCLEPEESNYARLQLNLALNPNLRIRCHRAALWTGSGSLNFSNDFRDGKEWASRFVEGQKRGNIKPQEVAAIDIAELAGKAGFAQVDFLKIDIEGTEADLLKSDSFLGFLKDKVRRLALEVHTEFIKVEEVQAILTSLGFQTKVISEFVCGVKVS